MASSTLKYAVIVVTGLVVVVLLSKWTGRKPVASTQVQAVVTRAAESNTASYSQNDPVASLVDVTTAIASLQTAVALSGAACVSNATGVPTHTLEREMTTHQSRLMRQVVAI
jgi:hypothetical protein